MTYYWSGRVVRITQGMVKLRVGCKQPRRYIPPGSTVPVPFGQMSGTADSAFCYLERDQVPPGTKMGDQVTVVRIDDPTEFDRIPLDELLDIMGPSPE